MTETGATLSGGSAARAVSLTLGGQWFKYVIQLATLVVLARLLTASDYGIIAMVSSVIGIGAVLGDFWLSQAAVQRLDLTPAQASNLFWINSVVGLVLGGIVLLIGPLLVVFYHQPVLASICAVLAPTFLLSGLAAQFRAEATRAMRFRWLAIVDVASQGSALLVALIIAIAGGGYWALVWQLVALPLSTLVMLVLATKWRPGLPSMSGGMRGLISFGASTVATQGVNYVSSNLDSVLVGRYWGSADLGIYTRAYQLFALPIAQLAQPLTRVALPILARLTDGEQYLRYLKRSQLVLCYLLIGVLAVVASAASPLLGVVLGPQWSGGGIYLEILAIGGVFQALGYAYYWVFLSKAKMAVLFWCELTGRGIMVGLLLVLVPHSPVFAAVAVSVGLFANWLIISVFGLRRVGVRFLDLVRPAGRPLVLWTTMYFAAFVVGALLRGAGVHSLPIQLAALLLTCLLWAALGLLVPAIRSDARTIFETAMLVRRR
jgi:O-antigen/teichoic acid export membrane protein